MSSKMILSLITEVAQEVIDEMKSDKEEERMVVVATYNEDEDVEETDTESVFVIPKGVDLEDADEVEDYSVKYNHLVIRYTNGSTEEIEPLIGRDNDYADRLYDTDISIMWKKTWCDAYRYKEEEVEKRLKKVKRITKKFKQDAIERHLARNGKKLSNLRRHTEKSLDGVIEKHNIDIKYYQRLFMREKISEEIEDKKREIRRAKQEEEWKIERQVKKDYLGKYSIPYDTMANQYVVIKHLTQFLKEKDPEYVKRNQLLKERKEIAEEIYRQRCGIPKSFKFDVDTGYEEEMTQEHIEELKRRSGTNKGEGGRYEDFFYKFKLGYYLD